MGKHYETGGNAFRAAFSEKHIEEYLSKQVKKSGGIAYKFSSPARRGVPDRMCLFPESAMMFVELKAPGKKPTNLQLHEHKKIEALGFEVFVIDSKEQVDELIKMVEDFRGEK